MAVHDHTARAYVSFSSAGDMFTVTPVANPTASCTTAQSLRLSALDDVAMALYTLAILCIEDERCRMAQAGLAPAEPGLWPLPPLFREGVALAIHCLEQYARQLDGQHTMNA